MHSWENLNHYGRHKAQSIKSYIVESDDSSVGLLWFLALSAAAMALPYLNVLLNVSLEASRLSAEAMIGSFFAAAFLIVIPGAFVLIWASQRDAISR